MLVKPSLYLLTTAMQHQIKGTRRGSKRS